MMMDFNSIDLNDDEAANNAISSVVNGIVNGMGTFKKLFISLAGMKLNLNFLI